MINIDSGYSSIKVFYKNQWKKIPSCISFSNSGGMTFGDSINEYKFEGDTYTIGDTSVDEEAFVTTDFKFKYKFEPLIVAHVRDTLHIPSSELCNITLSLALTDWDKKEELAKRCSEFEINGNTLKNTVNVIPQGIGAYYDWIHNQNNDNHPDSAYLIDIGFSTINVIVFSQGKPLRNKSKGFPNHGVSSIIKPFTNHLEKMYSMPFSEQESIKIFTTNKFVFNGEVQDKVTDVIASYKSQFVKRIFSSILVQDKKLLATSEAVIIAGGGCYFLEGTAFPPNVFFVEKPYEFSNLRGMVYLSGDE